MNQEMRIKRELEQFLEHNEELISVGYLQTRTSIAARALTMGYSNLANQGHYIRLTNNRVIIVPLNRMTYKPKKDEVFSVSFDEVEIEGDKLLIQSPNKNKPQKYHFMSGY